MKISSAFAASLLLATTIVARAGNGTEPRNTHTPIAGAGCKSVALFTSSAVPALQKDGCVGCHGGANPTATSALDLRNLGKDDIVACASVLAKVNLADKPQSSILQTVTGTGPHLGGKVPDAPAYTSSLLAWINAE